MTRPHPTPDARRFDAALRHINSPDRSVCIAACQELARSPRPEDRHTASEMMVRLYGGPDAEIALPNGRTRLLGDAELRAIDMPRYANLRDGMAEPEPPKWGFLTFCVLLFIGLGAWVAVADPVGRAAADAMQSQEDWQ